MDGDLTLEHFRVYVVQDLEGLYQIEAVELQYVHNVTGRWTNFADLERVEPSADAHRAADGTTWIADMKRGVVEQWSVEGQRLRQIEGLPNAHDIDVLPSGNVLVTLRTTPQGREALQRML